MLTAERQANSYERRELPGAERYETETLFTTMTLTTNTIAFGGYLKAYYNRTNFDLLQELTNGVRYGGTTGGSSPGRRLGFTE